MSVEDESGENPLEDEYIVDIPFDIDLPLFPFLFAHFGLEDDRFADSDRVEELVRRSAEHYEGVIDRTHRSIIGSAEDKPTVHETFGIGCHSAGGMEEYFGIAGIEACHLAAERGFDREMCILLHGASLLYFEI